MNQGPTSDPNMPIHEDTSNNPLALMTGAVGDLITGATIPAPIRKNMFKAFNQLCTAAMEVPVAYLEGVAAEKRAETKTRVEILSTCGKQISSQLNVDPQFAQAAANKFGQRIIREQLNLNKVAEAAAAQLKADTSESSFQSTPVGTTAEPPLMSNDWLNSFEKEAAEKSSDEMQLLFGKILAGEIKRPSSFSIKTIKLVGQLDATTATIFQTLCSLSLSLRAINMIVDARVCSLGGAPGANCLKDYGLNFEQLTILQ